MSSNDYILLGAAAGLVTFFLGYWIGRREVKRGIPDFKVTSPPPRLRLPYPKQVKDLEEGKVYNCAFTEMRVRVRRKRIHKADAQPHLRDVADCVRWNSIRGKEEEAHYYDDELLAWEYADTHPSEAERIKKQWL